MTAAATDLVTVIADALQAPQFGMSADIAETLAAEIIRVASTRPHAGAEYYLPTSSAFDRCARDAAIRAEWKGNNVAALC